MSWGVVGGILAPVLVFLAALAGYLLKQANDKKERESRERKEEKDREEAARQAAAALETKRAQEAYDQMQEDLKAARDEMRSLRSDLVAARDELSRAQSEIGTLWSQTAALRRENEAQEVHIADVHRWDDNGRKGPMPARVKAA